MFILPLEIDAKISPNANTFVIPYFPWAYAPRRGINQDGFPVDMFERIELRRRKYFDGTRVISRWVLEEWPDGIPQTESIFAMLKRVGLL